MPSSIDPDDPWLHLDGISSASSNSQQPALHIRTIEGVTPLDAQIGAFPKKTVPDALYDALFGQPKPTATEVHAADGDVTAIIPMNTYAILDAAKITNLPDILEGSGLEYTCLFKGSALEDLKNIAPWIVSLGIENLFTRNLFTKSNMPFHLWDEAIVSGGSMFCRSYMPIDEIKKHFRRFTQVKNESGKIINISFWSPSFLSAARHTTTSHREDMVIALLSAGPLITIQQHEHGKDPGTSFLLMSIDTTKPSDMEK